MSDDIYFLEINTRQFRRLIRVIYPETPSREYLIEGLTFIINQLKEIGIKQNPIEESKKRKLIALHDEVNQGILDIQQKRRQTN